MLTRCTRVLDFDGSVPAQTAHGLPAPEVIVDCTDLGPAARLWASAAQRAEVRRRLQPAQRSCPTFIGSGDFHHISALLLEQFGEPLTVVVFDHHPDWERLPPRYGCGAWINRALELPQVRQILHVGAGSGDLNFPAAFTGNRAAVREGRLRLLTWSELASDPDAGFAAALARINPGSVYVSVDKDCLRSAFALTNWEEGKLELDFLLRCLQRIRTAHDIAGFDVTGEYSPVHIRSRFKAWCARFDHPRDYTASNREPNEILRLNAATNLRILREVIGR